MLSKDVGASSNLLEERVSLLALAGFNAFLNHIVSIAVLHHLVERTIHGLGCSLLGRVIVLIFVVVLHDLINYLLLVFITAVFHALLYHITGELVVTQCYHITLNLPYNFILVFLYLAMF